MTFYTEDEMEELRQEIINLRIQLNNTDRPNKEEKSDYFKGEYYKKILHKVFDKVKDKYPSINIKKIRDEAFAETKKEFGGK